MGISSSCPFAEYIDLGNSLESILIKSTSFGDEEKTLLRSISFTSRDSESKVLKSASSQNVSLEGSISFKGRDLENLSSTEASSLETGNDIGVASISPKSEEFDNQSLTSDNDTDRFQMLPVLDPTNPKHAAALKLQKVYKSFRTRRKLADCAVLVEQSWWKLLDFAELKRSSISFFDMQKRESAISRWSRARTRAAKVGKGLSKNAKARKLSLQHWLEAIDPRHRYGHNLHFYYMKWLHSQSKEPFFYWLDIGEGKEVNLVEKCPRWKLQQQCIKYLGPMERLAYEVIMEDGKLVYKQSGKLVHTIEEAKNTKWIFVLSTSKTMYVGKKKKGTFQHSSFLAGGATTAAGRLVVDNGVLKAVWPHSGHYRPTEENFKDLMSFLKENNVDLTDVKTSPVDEGDDYLDNQKSSRHIRNNSSEEDFIEKLNGFESEENNIEESTEGKSDSFEQRQSSIEISDLKRHNIGKKLSSLEIPNRAEVIAMFEKEQQDVETSGNNGFLLESPVVDSYQYTENYFSPKPNVSGEDQGNTEVKIIPEESVLRRLNSHKEANSYQLGKQLSCRWTTGAGPRIGCVRDYPSELQLRALEQVSLSPRCTVHSRHHCYPYIAIEMSPRSVIPPTSQAS
ncbi:IQ domain-containing protein IQM2-like [Benincasa hispida]|uniref:IQ domain-containing protein IQM2-like n=1 Tax=Benincasa hispida TaxID=102211 RepID=UPI001901D856|nr:IQ domain-containing protein IQM2-like [Benincasa hispida]